MSGKTRQRIKNKHTDSQNESESKKSRSPESLDSDNLGVKISFKRIIIRCLVIVAIISIVSFNYKDQFVTFASEKDDINKKEEVINCSEDYTNELRKFSGCVPKSCGRMVSDAIITFEEAHALLMIAQKGFTLGGSGGGASILDLHSGALSKDDAFINIYKIDKDHKIITNADLKVYSHIKNKIKAAIVKHFGVKDKSLYLTHPTFFSRITSQPAQTIHDEYWHPHVDKETYNSFHYTSLLYLTDYGKHFKGGRFVFVDSPSNKTIEPKSGRLSAFTSGSENLHFVEKVSSGTRFAITVSFSCDPKYAIDDPHLPNTR